MKQNEAGHAGIFRAEDTAPPRDHSTQFNTLSHWIVLARTRERGLFDGVFIADIVGTCDVYGGGLDPPVPRAQSHLWALSF
jgi:alkanesulfonate monooxygenase SsuD/methylene tetrahydromethanopterin reductase-like flavin-dependent oxidoreductase (luciferase family)